MAYFGWCDPGKEQPSFCESHCSARGIAHHLPGPDAEKNISLKITPDSSYKNDGCLREGTGRETDSSQDSEMRRLPSRDPRCQTSGGNGRHRTKINPIIAKQTERSPPSRIRPLCPPSTNSTPPRTDEAKLVSTIKDIASPTGSRDAEEG